MDGSKKRILLVEDQAVLALEERCFLETNGYSVVHVRSGLDAVKAVVSDIDLVVMDINLGDGMNGFEAAEKILLRRELPLVFLSSHTSAAIVEKAYSISPYGYVVKSSGLAVLHYVIKAAFELHASKINAIHEARNWVKKSLQLMSSVLDYKNDVSSDCCLIYNECISRLETLALIYEQISVHADDGGIPLRTALESLTEDIRKLLKADRKIRILTYIDNVYLNPKMYIALGLLIHELVLDSVLNHYPGRKRGSMLLSLFRKKDESLEILLGDDGLVSRTVSSDYEVVRGTLISELSRYLSASIEKKQGDGTMYRICLPKPS